MIYSFAVVVTDADLTSPASADADALFEVGCDDALLASEPGAQRVIFDREASSFADAVASAITAVEAALPRARVTAVQRIDPADARPQPQPA